MYCAAINELYFVHKDFKGTGSKGREDVSVCGGRELHSWINFGALIKASDKFYLHRSYSGDELAGNERIPEIATNQTLHSPEDRSCNAEDVVDCLEKRL